MANPHAIPITLSEADRSQFQGWVRRRKTGQALATRARIALPARPAPVKRAERPPGAALVLFVDQLEELFTIVAARYRGAFIRLLALAAGDPRLRVLATLRADFLPQCAAEPALATLLQGGAFVLGPPGPEALLDMIRRPAERAGLDLEEGLAGVILRDAGGDPGEALPLVAFCLEELYRRTAPEHRLTHGAYRAMGGLRGAISRRADALLEEFRKAERAELGAVLPQVSMLLVSPPKRLDENSPNRLVL